MSAELFSGLAFVVLALVWWAVAQADKVGWRKTGYALLNIARRRAALVICLGLALVATDWLVLGDLTYDQVFWQDVHDERWISLTGVALALIGVYHWITLPLRD